MGTRGSIRLRHSRRRMVTATLTLVFMSWTAANHARADTWLRQSRILVPADPTNTDCRSVVCKHNENTDLTRWRGAVWLVHRTAESQIRGPNSSLRISRSTNAGRTFALQAIIPADPGRDLRDPHFYRVGKRLFINAITRLPGLTVRDTAVDSISVETHSTDGRHWSPLRAIGPVRWSFWRVAERRGSYYAAAYDDGNQQVKLFRSSDGESWTACPQIDGGGDRAGAPAVGTDARPDTAERHRRGAAGKPGAPPHAGVLGREAVRRLRVSAGALRRAPRRCRRVRLEAPPVRGRPQAHPGT